MRILQDQLIDFTCTSNETTVTPNNLSGLSNITDPSSSLDDQSSLIEDSLQGIINVSAIARHTDVNNYSLDAADHSYD